MEENFESNLDAETLGEYAALLWHWAWLLALCALLFGGAVYGFSSHQTPVYQATAQVLVDSSPNSQVITNTTLTASQQLAATYAQQMIAPTMMDNVAKSLNLPTFPKTANVQVTPIQNTQMMNVIVQDTDPKRAVLLASTLVQVFSDRLRANNAARYTDTKKGYEDQLANLDILIQNTSSQLATLTGANQDQNRIDQLQTSLTGYRESYANVLQGYEQVKLAEAQASSGIILWQPPVTPDAPVKPTPLRDGLLAALVGLVLAVGTVFLIDFLDTTIRDPQEITRRWGVPVLGTILRYAHEENSLITALQPRSPIAEAFRSLRTNLNFASINNNGHTFLVTSPWPGDGKTTIAANLANVIAQSGRKVVLVDADLRKPRLHRLFQMKNRIGLTNQFLLPDAQFNDSLLETLTPGLEVLTAGKLPPNPAELLGSEKMNEVLKQLAEQFDVIILDTAPLLVVTDALVLAQHVDGVILVIKPSITKREAIKNAFDQLNQVKANVMGVVMNDVNIDGRSGYYHYAGYYYSRKYGKGYHQYGTVDAASQEPKGNEGNSDQ